MIIQALHYGAKLHQEQLHQEELGIATLSALFVNSNRDPKKGEAAKPSDFFYHKPSSEEDKLDPMACDVFFSLVADEKMPSWVAAIAPIEKLRSSRVNGTISGVRAWLGRGVLLISPKIVGGVVKAPVAMVDGVCEKAQLRDVDSGSTHQVFIPKTSGETYWIKDVEFQLLS